jgi:hypothetical protein
MGRCFSVHCCVTFEDLITEYLEPLIEDPEEKNKLAASLLSLRNQVSGSFLFLNALFVIMLFVLQLSIKDIGIKWFCGENKVGISALLTNIMLQMKVW